MKAVIVSTMVAAALAAVLTYATAPGTPPPPPAPPQPPMFLDPVCFDRPREGDWVPHWCRLSAVDTPPWAGMGRVAGEPEGSGCPRTVTALPAGLAAAGPGRRA
jgi:hypothetical protein